MPKIFANADWHSDSRVAQLQAQTAPNASRDERRPPIPAVMVLRFAHEQATRVTVTQGTWRAVLHLEFAPALPRAGEANPQFVATDTQVIANRAALRHEHIVRLDDQRAVQPNLRVGVQTTKTQRGSRAELTHRKLEAVESARLPNPLHVVFMLRNVRV